MSRLLNAIKNPKRALKRTLPRSLFARALLILLTPLILVQVVLGYIFIETHTETILRQLSTTIAGDVALVLDWVERDPKSIKSIQTAAEKYMGLNVNFAPQNTLHEYGAHKDSWLYGFMVEALDNVVGKPYYLRMKDGNIYISVEAKKKKGVLEVSLPRRFLFSRTTPRVLMWTAASALLLFLVASIFMRNQIRPLRRLAEAADRFGKGDDLGELKIEGALELRMLSRIFNIMRARIQRHLHERTQLLASVSHDLRTPITRMQLQLAMMPEGEDQRMLQEDLKQMQFMVEGFLAYAKGTAHEARQVVPIASYIQELIDNLPGKTIPIEFMPEDNPTIQIKLQLFNRLLTNLLLNANRYSSHAWLSLKLTARHCEIVVEDDGPGIPEENRELVFQPFYRQDASRNLDEGGTGIGLSIVRDAVRSHGGRIRLDQSVYGGLKVVLTFPRF
jgi:two-component system, OmpR family, osmolarity sensor histidine kinase EnvZ